MSSPKLSLSRSPFSLGNTAVKTPQRARRSPRSGRHRRGSGTVPRPVTPGSAARAGIPRWMERRGKGGSSRSAEDLPGRRCPRDSSGERRGTRREAPGGPDSPACGGGRARRARSAAERRPARRRRRAAAGGPCRAERARTWGRGGVGGPRRAFYPPTVAACPPPRASSRSCLLFSPSRGCTGRGDTARRHRGRGSRPSRPLRPAAPRGRSGAGPPSHACPAPASGSCLPGGAFQRAPLKVSFTAPA